MGGCEEASENDARNLVKTYESIASVALQHLHTSLRSCLSSVDASDEVLGRLACVPENESRSETRFRSCGGTRQSAAIGLCI